MIYTVSLKSCRICLSSDNKALKSMFNCFINDLDYMQIYEYCTGNKIIGDADDLKYPTGICDKCEELLIKLYKFKKFSESCELVLNMVFHSEENTKGTSDLRNLSVDVEIDMPEIEQFYKVEERGSPNGEEIDDSADDEDSRPSSSVQQKFLYIYSDADEQMQDSANEAEVEIEPQVVDDWTLAQEQVDLTDPPLIESLYNSDSFASDYCDIMFESNDDLEVNDLSHPKKQQSYKCKYCNEDFILWISLRNHIDRTHTFEKRYDCNLCNSKFTLATDYFAHLKTHENKFHCNICNSNFPKEVLLTAHMKIHSNQNIENIVCGECRKTFSKTEHLDKHILKYHSFDY